MRLRDADLAAEVVQETFLEALRGLERFRGGSTPRTWLVGILKHKIIDQHRVRSRRGVGQAGATENDDDTFFDARGSWKAGVVRWVEPPDDAALREEFWEVFRACLAAIPANYADAFTLVELEELSAREACELLGITPANLLARLHRARLHLRKALEERWLGRDENRT